MYAIVAKSNNEVPDELLFEAHRKYIDIHYLLSGENKIGWKPQKGCDNIVEEYDYEKDVELYSGTPEQWIILTPGLFALFLPFDAHAPQCHKEEFHKVVIKVSVI